MNQAEIQAAIPHRGPMLLVDEIVQRDENRIVGRKTFHSEEFFFQGHYPDFPLVPGVILCEAAMQCGAVLLSSHFSSENGSTDDGSSEKIAPVATRMNEVKFKRMVRPGETIDMEVKLEERLADAFFLSAKVTCEGKLAAKLQFVCTLAKR